MAGIAIDLCCFQSSCRYSSAARPVCFAPLFFYPLGTIVLYHTHMAIVNSFYCHYRQKQRFFLGSAICTKTAGRPCCFPPLSHRDALIIYLNNQRVNPFFANFSTFFITFLSVIIGARHRHISEHIFDNSLSITAYRYSDIDRLILIKSYRYNYIDTGVSIRGV